MKYEDTLRKEEWRPIPGYPLYEASNFGRVKSHKRGGRIMSQIKTGVKNKHYMAVSIYTGKLPRRTKLEKVHRLVLMAFDRLPNDEDVGCHKDDDQTFNHFENLYWGSRKDNTRDAIANGKFVPKNGNGRGDSHPSTRLSDKSVAQIHAEYTGARGQQIELARKYGVCQSHISKILSRIGRKARSDGSRF